ncbi:hypothetical protein [Aromatoleum toluclasticum]|uniref:hypothetical protein n=1 Tax=Aromatoleum toluclasticum TaxID=92003 RepID=UPI0012FB602A|nr:hypothetical protein [Aromatoleum toluclasticum]
MKFWIALLVNISATGAIAGPLGLDMGMSYDILSKNIKLKQVKPFLYSTPSLQKDHSDFDDYQLLITPKHGLCKVVAWSKAIPTSVYGEGLKDKFEKIETAISQKYGQGKKFDLLRSGSIWNEQRDWMMGLRKNERTLAEFWTDDSSELPDNIHIIALKAHAAGTETGLIELGYEFKNSSECIDWIKSQENSSL